MCHIFFRYLYGHLYNWSATMSFLALPPPLLGGEESVMLLFTSQNWSAGINVLHHAGFVVDPATCESSFDFAIIFFSY
jgi:hypothetical protein